MGSHTEGAVLIAAAIFVAVLGMLLVSSVGREPREARGSGRPIGAPAADPERLRIHVEALAGGGHGPRDFSHPEGLERAAEYITAALRKLTPTVSTQPYEVSGRLVRNVIARFGPDGPERIVVGAHYDTAGPLPGADDNASGVAGLLELARLLAAAPPPMRVELVAFTLEEPPFFTSAEMGSAVHAASVTAEGARVRLMMSLEMIGYFSDARRSQRFPVPGLGLFYPDRGNFIAVVGKLGQREAVRRVRAAMRAATPLGVHSINAPRALPGVDLSDHRNYWDRGWNAVMITDTAFFRNPNYHAWTDTPDTLDYSRMAQVVEGVAAAVHAVALR